MEAISKKLRENPGWTAPHLAAASGFLNCLKHEKMKSKLNEQEGTLLRTPLMVAVDQNNIGSVATLLELGVDLRISDIKGNSLFHVAANKSSQSFRVYFFLVTNECHE